jgi:hypothetical protein
MSNTITNPAQQQLEAIDPSTGELVGLSQQGMAMSASEGEINMQITTAKRYPRSVKAFRNKVLELCTLNEAVAAECIYALPRGGKVIEGASIRFAEIVQSAWGNCRVGGKVVEDDGRFLTCQGMFHDLESNSAIAMEVRRKITDSKGRKYNDDMIGVAGAAGTSIAIRNAILRGVPKAFWADLYDSARQVVAGDYKTLANRRQSALQAFVIYGVTPEQIYTLLEIASLEEMTIDHLVQLRGVLNAIKDGNATVEDIFKSAAQATAPETRPTKEAAKPKTEAKAKDKPPAKATEAKADVQAQEEPRQETPAQEHVRKEPATSEWSAELTRALDILRSSKHADDIGGMRSVLREDLSPSDFALWQGEAMKLEMQLAKGKGR